MRIIAIEEAFAYPPITEATNSGAGFATLKEHYRLFQAIEERLEDLAETRLADMDSGGIDFQVISHTAPGPDSLDAALANRLTREANDALAKAVAAHPDRFAAFATLPMTDPHAAASELERAVRDLGFRGALINGTIRGRFLDDSAFAPVLAKAESLGVPLYLHPSLPPPSVMQAYFSGLSPLQSFTLATGAWGWHCETGLHTLRLITAGIFDRYPGLQMIIGHMGEMLPFALGRTDAMLTPFSKHLRQRVAEYFQTNIWITTSGVFTHPPLQCALSVIGADRILFAVDYPYSANVEHPERVNEEGRRFLDTAPISPADRAKIAHRNAERLLKI